VAAEVVAAAAVVAVEKGEVADETRTQHDET
jgi:hypothetical protein